MIPIQFKDTVARKYGYDFPEPANETELMAYRMLEEAGLLYAQSKEPQWISVNDRPLVIVEQGAFWTCTEDGENEFMAAVPLSGGTWWIRHCVIEDRIGLCVVGDDGNEPAGWEISDVEYYQFIPEPPKPEFKP